MEKEMGKEKNIFSSMILWMSQKEIVFLNLGISFILIPILKEI